MPAHRRSYYTAAWQQGGRRLAGDRAKPPKGGVGVEPIRVVLIVFGFAGPIIAAPFVAHWLRPLFTLFLREGAELIGGIDLPDPDAASIGRLLARLNVAILLVAWLVLFACNCFDHSPTVLGSVAIGGILAALGISIIVARTNLEVDRRSSVLVGAIVFAGGNLPLILVGAAMLALM